MTQHARKDILLAFGWYDYHIHAGIVRHSHKYRWNLHVALNAVDQWLPKVWHGDGMILCQPTGKQREVFNQLIEKSHVPAILMGEADPSPLAGAIALDEHAICQLAARYFIQRGFTRFLWVGDNRKGYGNILRRRYFKEALAKAGHQCEVLWWSPTRNGKPFTPATALTEILKQARPFPLALFAVSDLVATRVIHACLDVGIRVPEDIAVLGVDNNALYGNSAPVTLSSIDSQTESMGFRAAELLDNLMQGSPLPTAPILIPPTDVVTRKSTDILATGHPKVREAINYISDHFRETIRISEISQHIGMSVEGLRKAVRNNASQSLANIIMKRRLDEAKRLLRTTDLKLNTVAIESGLRDSSRLCLLFRREFKTTPAAYRKESKESDTNHTPHVEG